MASTITIVCPECDKEMKAPAEVEGKKIRCKCGHAFVARPAGGRAAPAKKAAPAKGPDKTKGKPAPAPAAAPARKPSDDDDADDGKAYGLTYTDLSARCPNCANEMESAEAVICLTCGYNTRTREQGRTRKVHDITGFEIFLWLLPGIACALVVLTLLTFDIVYCVKIKDWVDESGFIGTVLTHGATKMWLVIISLFFVYVAGKFAIKRLIYHPKPPEVEKLK